MVTVEGLHYCLGGKSTLDLLACVLAFMAKREKAFVPTSSQPDLVVRFDEVKNELGLSSLELAQARVLVSQFEPRASRGVSHGANGDWSFTLDLEGVRRFRGIRDGAEYLLAHTDTSPSRTAWSRRKWRQGDRGSPLTVRRWRRRSAAAQSASGSKHGSRR